MELLLLAYYSLTHQIKEYMDEQDVRRIIEEVLTTRFGDRGTDMVIDRRMRLLDGRNIRLGRTTGTQLGTNAEELLGFYGGTPVNKPPLVASPSADTSSLKIAVDALRQRLGTSELNLIR